MVNKKVGRERKEGCAEAEGEEWRRRRRGNGRRWLELMFVEENLRGMKGEVQKKKEEWRRGDNYCFKNREGCARALEISYLFSAQEY